LRTAVGESRALKGDLRWTDFIRYAKVPSSRRPSGGHRRLLGLAFALTGVGLARSRATPASTPGQHRYRILLAVIAFVLAVEMKSLLIAKPPARGAAPICAALEGPTGSSV